MIASPFRECVLLALVAVLAGDGPLVTIVRGIDPATGESNPLAGASVAFQEWRPDAEGERGLPMPLVFAESDERGRCSFSSAYSLERWRDVEGSLIAFKPGYVVSRIDPSTCRTPDFELSRGLSAHTRLRAPAGADVDGMLECTAHFPVQLRASQRGFGKSLLQLKWRRDPDGEARIDFDQSGFERADSTALLFFANYDAIEIGPSHLEEFVLRPQRCLQLRVCDWDTGAPIDGVHPVLRFGAFDEGGHFQPSREYRSHRWVAEVERNEALSKFPLNREPLCSARILLPGEVAAQLTNLPHRDYMPMIYVAKGGAASPTPITLLGPDSGDGECTLFLRRRK